MPIAKHWCFTINNYEEDEIDRLSKLIETPSVRYLVFQQEEGESGTPHIQGYICLAGKQRLSGVKKLVGDRAHCEVARGSPQQNRSYCTKTETRKSGTDSYEFGICSVNERAKKGIHAFMDDVKSGLLDRQQLRETHPEVWSRFPRFCLEYIGDHTPIPDIPDHEMHQWQKDLLKKLLGPTNDREVIFVVDKDGNKGKTWFAKKFCSDVPTAFYAEPAKKADMAYALPYNVTHVLVNITRSLVEKSDYLYTFCESIKDGMIFSPKYESCMKVLGPCHVCVFMNSDPDPNMLSADRYTVIRV